VQTRIVLGGSGYRERTTAPTEPPAENGPARGRHGLARTSSGIAVLAAAGVLTGFAVDATIAALFGASGRTDAFFIAATIPFALASVLLASANQALVPLINTWFREHGSEGAMGRVDGLLGTSLVVTTVVAALGILLSPILPSILAPGASSATRSSASAITALLFVTVVTRVGAEVIRALLNARFSFAAPASMPIAENLAVLVTTLLLADRLGVPAVAVGYVVGGVLQLAYMYGVARSRGLRIRPRVRFRDPEIRVAFRLLRLPLAGTGLNMIARAVERFLASFLPAGSITILNYAWVVVNSLGGAIFFRSVVVALLPRLSEARHEDAVSRRIVGDGIKLMGLISIPLTAIVIVLAQPLVSLFFQRGAFDATSAALLGTVLAIYALQFPLDALTRVFQSFWYSRLDTVVPFHNVALGVGLDIALAAILVWPFGIRGLALAYVLSSIGNLLHGYLTVDRRISLPLLSLLRILGKIVVASAIAGAAAAAMLAALPASTGPLSRVVDVAVPGAVAAAVLVLALLVLRVRIWRLVRGRDDAIPP
jgi:putative peptidoglycan lipid II flippase